MIAQTTADRHTSCKRFFAAASSEQERRRVRWATSINQPARANNGMAKALEEEQRHFGQRQKAWIGTNFGTVYTYERRWSKRSLNLGGIAIPPVPCRRHNHSRLKKAQRLGHSLISSTHTAPPRQEHPPDPSPASRSAARLSNGSAARLKRRTRVVEKPRQQCPAWHPPRLFA